MPIRLGLAGGGEEVAREVVLGVHPGRLRAQPPFGELVRQLPDHRVLGPDVRLGELQPAVSRPRAATTHDDVRSSVDRYDLASPVR